MTQSWRFGREEWDAVSRVCTGAMADADHERSDLLVKNDRQKQESVRHRHFYLIIVIYLFKKKKKAFRFLNIAISLIIVSMQSLKTLQDIIAHYFTPRSISVDLWYLSMSKNHTITGVVIVQILLETYQIFFLKLPQLLLIPTLKWIKSSLQPR